MIEKTISAKIQELIPRGRSLSGGGKFSECHGWLAEAAHIVELAIPYPDAAYRKRIDQVIAANMNATTKVGAVAEILAGFSKDVEVGLIGTLGNRIRADTFDDFL